LTQVFRNLFENSLAATHGHVIVTITAEGRVDGNSTRLRIYISDNGPGFSEPVKRQAFDPFFTTRTKGTGLGLAITRRIVEAHGGSIDIETNHRPGACIVIDLPRGLPT
jgi:hypothetical protein